MRALKSRIAVASVLALAWVAASSPVHAAGTALHPATGIGSCTLKGWNPSTDPEDATNLPEGDRLQTYRPDDYNCTGAKFAAPGAEFTRFQQPGNFQPSNQTSMQQLRTVLQPAQAINPLAPFFPPFTHFVILYRENHTFDDYLGDCATTIQAGCNGVVQSTNHISSVPNLHTLARSNALLDSYSTGTQPPSGPNHWWLFSAQSQSSSQQQSYPTATASSRAPGAASRSS